MIGALAMLAALPTNLGALLILMVGVLGFAVLPFLRVRPLWIALAGLVLQAGGSLALYNNGVSVSPLLIAVTLVLPLAYHMLVLMPMLNRQRNQPPVTDRDSDLVGMKGRVVATLNPIGSVLVNNETWTAEAGRKIEAGMPIIVVDREGLKLIVEPGQG
ncbi:MAG: NfeD family protein [Chloroflexi bacterium]|nr:NfeD family protein [Chloroflexota bacterium]